VPGTVPTEGQPVGVIQIPKIGVNKVVVEGTATADLHLLDNRETRLSPGTELLTALPSTT
jgi:hypothetical protein